MAKQQSDLTQMVVGYVLKNGKVLLGLRKQTAWDLGKNLISGIGGKVGDQLEWQNESFDEALEREFQEEISTKPLRYHQAANVIFLFPNKPKWNQQVRVYLIDDLDSEPVETEAIAPRWYPVKNIPFDQMWDDSKYYLPQLLIGKHIEATFTYGPDNRTVNNYHVSER